MIISARQGFENLDAEIDIDDLDVEGELPPWLAGSLLRTGPARWDLGHQTVNHWFDGLAMLHRFTFADGRASYANRFLRSRAFQAADANGKLGYREFATDPCRSAFRRVMSVFDPKLTDNAAVNVTRLGDSYLALTELPMPVRFDPQTLETLGVEGKPPGMISTAHPHLDPVTGELVGFATALVGRAAYILYAMDANGGQREIARIRVRRPAYHHSFGLTERYAVLYESALVVDPLRLGFSGKPFIENFRWRPQDGSRFWVIDRLEGRVLGAWETDPFFCFHHVNAYEQDGELVIDLLAYDDAEVVWALGLQRLRDGEPVPHARLHRYRLSLAAPHRVTGETLSEEPFELPRIDYRRVNGRPYRYTYGTRGNAFFDGIVKVDVQTGESLHWAEDGAFPGEPVYVPRPGGDAEDDGVLLSVVLEPDRGASSLLVLDAEDLEVVARARVPHHIPFGFHGQFFGATGGSATAA